jgi:hypothetical protein
MEISLLTFGDSFTYGEGLQFHLWKERYKDTFELYKNKKQYFPCHTIVSSVKIFDEYRIKNNYSNVLNEKLNTSLISSSQNGGSNIRNLDLLNTLIEYLETEKNVVPKYCVFQFTDVSRDFFEIQNNDYYYKIFGKEFVNNICSLNSNLGKTSTDILDNIVTKIIDVLILKFNILETKYNCKCLYFIGLNEGKWKNNNINNSYYFPICYNDILYDSWNMLNKNNNWTLKQNIDVNDGHPCLESHNWLANELYNTLIINK